MNIFRSRLWIFVYSISTEGCRRKFTNYKNIQTEWQNLQFLESSSAPSCTNTTAESYMLSKENEIWTCNFTIFQCFHFLDMSRAWADKFLSFCLSHEKFTKIKFSNDHKLTKLSLLVRENFSIKSLKFENFSNGYFCWKFRQSFFLFTISRKRRWWGREEKINLKNSRFECLILCVLSWLLIVRPRNIFHWKKNRDVW